MAVLARTPWHAVGAQLGTFYCGSTSPNPKARSRCARPNRRESPLIDFHLLSDRRDHERMKIAFRTIADLALDPQLDAVRHEVFPTICSFRIGCARLGTDDVECVPDGRCLRRLSRYQALRAVNSSRPYRTDRYQGDCLPTIAALDQFLHDAIVGVWHACGSCRMGAEGRSAGSNQFILVW